MSLTNHRPFTADAITHIFFAKQIATSDATHFSDRFQPVFFDPPSDRDYRSTEFLSHLAGGQVSGFN